jgi:hypothetical protein
MVVIQALAAHATTIIYAQTTGGMSWITCVITPLNLVLRTKVAILLMGELILVALTRTFLVKQSTTHEPISLVFAKTTRCSCLV